MKPKHRLLRICFYSLAILAIIGILCVGFIRLRYGGGSTDFPISAGAPIDSAFALQTVADLDVPPGNIAVSGSGRIFFSYHPEAGPNIRVAELKNGEPGPYPSESFQGPKKGKAAYFDTVLSLRIDRRGRLWTLDLARHGIGQPRLLAFDLSTDELVHQFAFPDRCAGFGSHLNDFQVSPDGRTIYIADASIIAKNPAILVYDTETRNCRRLLESHPSVIPAPFIPVVQGRKMHIFGLFAVRPGVDSIALSPDGEWLYYAAVTSPYMYRVRTRHLKNPELSSKELGGRATTFARKPMSDGLTMDLSGNIYITAFADSAIVRMAPDGSLTPLVHTRRLRWPDGLGFGPDGYLYVTCSALHQVIGKSWKEESPFQIYRFKPGGKGIPGH
ncbi:MAG TPA: L-dopachrome tautomerase-related protein [Desulfosalsimonadaceae bacterium]|nr:L-dopachrome tautomerase-related protein [Desulfosalsimonadaceae bacterium]